MIDIIKQKLSYLFTPNARVTSRSFIKIMVIEVIFLLMLWQYNSSVKFPSPIAVVKTIPELFLEQNFLNHFLSTLFLALGALSASIFFSLLISYASRLPIGKPFAILTTKFRFFTFSGFVAIFNLALPGGMMFKCFSLVFMLVPWIVTASLTEFSSIENMRFIHLRTLGVNEWVILRELIVYGKWPQIKEIFRQTSAMLWMMIASVEMVYVNEGGVGALIEMKRKYITYLPMILGIQLLIFLFSIFWDYLINQYNKASSSWAYLSNEKK